MANISPNRQGLKDLSAFNIDSQFIQQIGSQVFNYSGEDSQQYRDMCSNLSFIINDSIEDLQKIKQILPVS